MPGRQPEGIRTIILASRHTAIVTLGLVLAATACDDSGGDRAADDAPDTLEASDAVEVVDVGSDEVLVELAAPAGVVVEAVAEDGHGLRVRTDEPAVRHEIPLRGLRPDREYRISLEVGGDAGGVEASDAGTVETDPLPDELPPVRVETADGVDGYTLFDVARNSPDGDDGDDGFLLVVDEDGEIVWSHSQAQSIQDARQLDNGDLVYTTNETGIRQLSFDGTLVREWVGRTGAEVAPEDETGRAVAGDDAVRVDTDQMHHEVRELPNGNLLTLSREVRTVEYPENLCDEDGFDGSYEVAGDVVVEFEPSSGEVVRELSLFDVLDPVANLDRTVTSEFCSGYLAPVYPHRDVRDWSHSNAVVLDEPRNRLLVSVRHTDEIIALRYEDDDEGPAGELLWSLGEGRDFGLAGEGEWFLHPHAPEIAEDGSILLYDNANRRPGTDVDDGPLPASRAVRYQLDEQTRTAAQVWAFSSPAGEGPLYAPYVGDADQTAAGTVLVAHGGLLDPPAHSPAAKGVLRYSRILEVDPDDDAVLLDLTVRDPDGETGWRSYRAERLESLYPPEFEAEVLG